MTDLILKKGERVILAHESWRHNIGTKGATGTCSYCASQATHDVVSKNKKLIVRAVAVCTDHVPASGNRVLDNDNIRIQF